MNSMVRERGSHVSRLFIEVTPGIRRALELLAEASITLLDEIDAPVDELEADPDFELTREDDEDGGDDEDSHDAEPEEEDRDLGWTVEGQIGGDDSDEDFVSPETSGGFPHGAEVPHRLRVNQKALFDPRISLRGSRGRFVIPPFPNESVGRARFYIDEEIRRLSRHLAKSGQRARRAYTNQVSSG